MNFQPNSVKKCFWNKQNIIYTGMKSDTFLDKITHGNFTHLMRNIKKIAYSALQVSWLSTYERFTRYGCKQGLWVQTCFFLMLCLSLKEVCVCVRFCAVTVFWIRRSTGWRTIRRSAELGSWRTSTTAAALQWVSLTYHTLSSTRVCPYMWLTLCVLLCGSPVAFILCSASRW